MGNPQSVALVGSAMACLTMAASGLGKWVCLPSLLGSAMQDSMLAHAHWTHKQGLPPGCWLGSFLHTLVGQAMPHWTLLPLHAAMLSAMAATRKAPWPALDVVWMSLWMWRNLLATNEIEILRPGWLQLGPYAWLWA